MKALETMLNEERLKEIKVFSLEKGRHDGSEIFEGQI